MCLVTKWKFPRLTLRNIKVYKVVKYYHRGEYISTFVRYPYIKGKMHSNSLFPLLSTLNQYSLFREVKGGYFHSYSTKADAILNKTSLCQQIVECTIPKFTLYFKDIDGAEFCSKRILIKKELMFR